MEKTLVLIKPDAFKRGLVGEIFSRFEKKGLKITHSRWWNTAPRAIIEEHYEEHKGKIFFEGNCEFMCSGPIMSLVLEGADAIERVRSIQGNVKVPGTIRGDLANDIRENLIHASDSKTSAEKEIALWQQ